MFPDIGSTVHIFIQTFTVISMFLRSPLGPPSCLQSTTGPQFATWIRPVMGWDMFVEPGMTRCSVRSYMGVPKNRGTPKWMVYMENPIKMDDLGVPLFLETPIYVQFPERGCSMFQFWVGTTHLGKGNRLIVFRWTNKIFFSIILFTWKSSLSLISLRLQSLLLWLISIIGDDIEQIKLDDT